MTTKTLPQDVKPLCQSAPFCPTSACVVLSSKPPNRIPKKQKETSEPTQGNGWQACLVRRWSPHAHLELRFGVYRHLFWRHSRWFETFVDVIF